MFSLSRHIQLALVLILSLVAAHATTRSTDYVSTKYPWEVDTRATLSKRSFKISPEKLIARAKEVINNGKMGFSANDLADDFVFQFPIIGPLSKKELLTALESFQVGEAFPDAQVTYYNFHVDPFEPNRVWYTTLFKGTHTGDGFLFGKATGKYVETPPQAMSLIFNEDGKVIKHTGGYVIDKELGNTGGLGGLFGPKYAIGRPFPFPEGKPWKPSFTFKLITFIQKLFTK